MAIKETNDEIKIIANTMTAGNINPAVVEILPTTTGDISILASVASIDSAVAPVTTAISAKDLYDVLPTNHVLSIAKLSNNYANNNKELPDMKGKLKSNIYDTGYEVMYKSPSQEFTIKFENFAPSKKSINFRKTLNYLWIEANKQNYNERIVFSLEDYQKKMGYASKDIAYKALKKCRDELMKMSITNSKFKYSKKNKKMKETVSSKMRIFYGGKVSYTNCVIMANAELIKTCLPVLDNLKRAKEHVPEGAEEWFKGIEMAITQLEQAFTNAGLEKIEAQGKPFNPDLHEALIQEPGEKDIITEELECGYMIGTRVIRHSKVKVGNGEKA